jgi:glycosyltransferase involved in cell wall biosynthesis
MTPTAQLTDRVGRLYQGARTVLPSPLRARLESASALLSRAPMPIRLTASRLRRRGRPDQLSVGWILSGDQNRGSTRIQGLLPHAYLRERGVDSVVLAKRQQTFNMRPKEMAWIARAGFDAVVFEGVFGESAEALARALQAAGTRTVYAAGNPVRTTMPEVVDWVVLISESMRGLVGGKPEKTSVIEAMIETPPEVCKDYSRSHTATPVRVVWVGYPENLHLLGPVREALRDPLLASYELVTISRGPGATLEWDRNRVWDQLLQCDIAVLPADESDWYQAKPNTRLTMLKAIGLPIVATPIPAYAATLTHGDGCYFARDAGEWVGCLRALSDPERRREMGLAERDEVLASYGPDAIGGRWLELIERVGRERNPLAPASV